MESPEIYTKIEEKISTSDICLYNFSQYAKVSAINVAYGLYDAPDTTIRDRTVYIKGTVFFNALVDKEVEQNATKLKEWLSKPLADNAVNIYLRQYPIDMTKDININTILKDAQRYEIRRASRIVTSIISDYIVNELCLMECTE